MVDSGVLIAAWIYVEFTPLAQSLIYHSDKVRDELHAPMLLRYECTAVIRKCIYRRRIDFDYAENAMGELSALKIQYHIDDDLLKRALAIATELNLPTGYDSQYLALAERLD